MNVEKEPNTGPEIYSRNFGIYFLHKSRRIKDDQKEQEYTYFGNHIIGDYWVFHTTTAVRK